MELRHLRYFHMLAQELHFGKASKRLFISQPPLSRQIKELEEELGAALFTRDNKRVALTEAGKFFLRETQDMLASLESAKQQVQSMQQSVTGELKIGYISAVDKSKLGSLIQHLQDEYPHLQTKIYELRTEKQVNALETGKLDVGIIRAPNYSPKLHTEKLYDDGFCLALPKGLELPSDFSCLQTRPFIGYHARYAPVYHEQTNAYCAQLGFIPNLRHECNNIASILELVHLNAGISVVPRSVNQQYKHLNIHFLEVENTTIKTEILFAYSRRIEHPAFHILRSAIIKLFEVKA